MVLSNEEMSTNHNDMIIRKKFVSKRTVSYRLCINLIPTACVENLANNSSALVALRLLPKLFGVLSQNAAGGAAASMLAGLGSPACCSVSGNKVELGVVCNS